MRFPANIPISHATKSTVEFPIAVDTLQHTAFTVNCDNSPWKHLSAIIQSFMLAGFRVSSVNNAAAGFSSDKIPKIISEPTRLHIHPLSGAPFVCQEKPNWIDMAWNGLAGGIENEICRLDTTQRGTDAIPPVRGITLGTRQQLKYRLGFPLLNRARLHKGECNSPLPDSVQKRPWNENGTLKNSESLINQPANAERFPAA